VNATVDIVTSTGVSAIGKEKCQSASMGVLYIAMYWTMYGQQSG
jgi:hypothetical protein